MRAIFVVLCLANAANYLMPTVRPYLEQEIRFRILLTNFSSCLKHSERNQRRHEYSQLLNFGSLLLTNLIIVTGCYVKFEQVLRWKSWAELPRITFRVNKLFYPTVFISESILTFITVILQPQDLVRFRHPFQELRWLFPYLLVFQPFSAFSGSF